MTFTIARNQIHIDWKLAGSVLITIITTTFGAAWYIRSGYDDYVRNQEKTNAALTAIQRQMAHKDGMDSIQTAGLVQVNRRMDSVALYIRSASTIVPNRHPSKFYTERWVNGHLIFTEVKPD